MNTFSSEVEGGLEPVEQSSDPGRRASFLCFLTLVRIFHRLFISRCWIEQVTALARVRALPVCLALDNGCPPFSFVVLAPRQGPRLGVAVRRLPGFWLLDRGGDLRHVFHDPTKSAMRHMS